MKKQLMTAMKQHGDGLKHLEDMTLQYGEEMLQKMEANNGKPFDPAHLLFTTTASIMMTLIYGHATEEDVTNAINIQKQILKVFQSNGAYLMLDMLPISRFIVPSVKKAYAEFMMVMNEARILYDSIAAVRRRTYEHPNVEFFIDFFLKLSATNEFDEDKTRVVEESDIRAVGFDMFGAGTLTTSKTLQMMLAVLVCHPEIQDSACKEIVEVIGKRKPRIEDRTFMPFTEALILETLRYHSLAIFAIPHQAKCNAELSGFFIPKGACIFPNLWSLHHDERYWDRPWEFNPNRFIEDGKVVPPDHKKKQRLFAFGAGRRQCAGEVFAKNRLFILTCLMLQKFKFVPAEGHPVPNDDPHDCTAELMLLIKEYKLCVQLRQ